MKPYKNIHEFLDERLNGKDASDAEIATLKAEYWRIYWKWYRRHHRMIKHEFTLRFDMNSIKKIEALRGPYTISQFLYHCVNTQLEEDKKVSGNDQDFLMNSHTELLEVITLLEDSLETDEMFDEDILDRLEVIEVGLNDFLKQHKQW